MNETEDKDFKNLLWKLKNMKTEIKKFNVICEHCGYEYNETTEGEDNICGVCLDLLDDPDQCPRCYESLDIYASDCDKCGWVE